MLQDAVAQRAEAQGVDPAQAVVREPARDNRKPAQRRGIDNLREDVRSIAVIVAALDRVLTGEMRAYPILVRADTSDLCVFAAHLIAAMSDDGFARAEATEGAPDDAKGRFDVTETEFGLHLSGGGETVDIMALSGRAVLDQMRDAHIAVVLTQGARPVTQVGRSLADGEFAITVDGAPVLSLTDIDRIGTLRLMFGREVVCIKNDGAVPVPSMMDVAL